MNTTQEARRLLFEAYRVPSHPMRPVDYRARTVELILTMGFDAEYPWRSTLEALQGIRPDLSTDGIDEIVDHLLDLADEVAYWEQRLRADRPFQCAVDEYVEALTEFAAGPKPEPWS